MLLSLEVSGGTGQVTIGCWMITLEVRVISEGITPTVLTGLAAVFAIYYMLNLQYQEEAACTLEFIQKWDNLNFLFRIVAFLVALYFTVRVLPWYIHGKYIVPTGKWVVTKYLPEVYVHGNT